MRFTLALAALVAAASALPSGPASKNALTTREDFIEDDFEIPAEPDDNAKRQAGSVDWPEVSSPGEERRWTPSIHLHQFTHPPYHPPLP